MKRYLRHKIANLLVVDEICDLEYINFSGKFSSEVDSHDFWEVCFAESGIAECIIDGKTFTIAENQLMFIPPNMRHLYHKKSDKAKFYCICFECLSPYIKPLSLRIFNTNEDQRDLIKKFIREGNASFTKNSAEQLVRKARPEIGCMQMLILLLESLIILTLRAAVDKPDSPIILFQGVDFYSSLTQQIKRYCIENVKQRLTLENISNEMGISVSYICKVFKSQTGDSVLNYFNSLKIEEAKKLLLNTSYNANQIAEILSFSDAKYFNTSFKKYVGVSPIVYRKNVTPKLNSENALIDLKNNDITI